MPNKPISQSRIRTSVEIPATDWHPYDKFVIKTKAKTEFEAFAQSTVKLLAKLGHNNRRLMLGYLLDLVNTLDVDLRTALIQGILKGYGLNIKSIRDPLEGEEGISVDLVQRYTPLTRERRTESGLILPGG